MLVWTCSKLPLTVPSATAERIAQNLLELGMGPVAQGWGSAVLTAAEIHFFTGLGRVFYRFQPGAFMRSVTERLASGFSTCAPEKGFAFGHLYRIGGFLGDDR